MTRCVPVLLLAAACGSSASESTARTSDTPQSSEAAPATTPVTDVAVGKEHVCAIAAGQVRCWGNNDFGQLGTGDTEQHLRPVPVRGVADPTALAATDAHTCALGKDGRVWCWGPDTAGTPIKEQVELPAPAVAITDYPLALLEDGSVHRWSMERPTEAEQVDELKTSAAVSGSCGLIDSSPVCLLASPTGPLPPTVAVWSDGGVHCARDAAGAVRCFGYLEGAGETLDVTAVPALRGATDIMIDGATICAVVEGSVSCVAVQGRDQHEHGDRMGRKSSSGSAPTPQFAAASNPDVSTLGKVTKLRGRSGTECAVFDDGRLACRGSNQAGLLATGTSGRYRAPQPMKAWSKTTSLALSNRQACATQASGEPVCVGFDERAPLKGAEVSSLSMSGYPSYSISGESTVCGVVDGEVVCDHEGRGQAAEATKSIDDAEAVELAAADDRDAGCVVHRGGTVSCWSGPGPGMSSSTDVNVASAVPGLKSVSQVAVGFRGACALSAGSAWCWPLPPAGKSPVKLEGLSDVVQLDMYSSNACAVTKSGEVWCWPVDFLNEPKPRPAQIAELSDVANVATGSSFSCATHRDGTVSCWGLCKNLPGSPTIDRWSAGWMDYRHECGPSKVAELKQVESMLAGVRIACALSRDKTVSCWGDMGTWLSNHTAVSAEFRVIPL